MVHESRDKRLGKTTIQNFYSKSFSELSSNKKENIATNFAAKNNLNETTAYEILFELNPVFIFKHLSKNKDTPVKLLYNLKYALGP